uniref:Receptor activity modifying protein 2 n=1 Tax=Leptobrachium leishanense TaxID=445787 RepID=A0A8C5PE34_9ANUR
MAWLVMTLHGMAWLGMAWLGLVWLGLACYDFAWYGEAWYGEAWLVMTLHGMAWLGMVSYLRVCLEDVADALKLAFPNDIAHGYIMMSHRTYFGNCTLILQELIDPPEHVLLALIFAPISIIPFLVTLVVCKSKTSEPQA